MRLYRLVVSHQALTRARSAAAHHALTLLSPCAHNSLVDAGLMKALAIGLPMVTLACSPPPWAYQLRAWMASVKRQQLEAAQAVRIPRHISCGACCGRTVAATQPHNRRSCPLLRVGCDCVAPCRTQFARHTTTDPMLALPLWGATDEQGRQHNNSNSSSSKRHRAGERRC